MYQKYLTKAGTLHQSHIDKKLWLVREPFSVLFFILLALPSQLSFIPFTSYSIKYPSSWVQQQLQGLLPGHSQIMLQWKRFMLPEAYSLLWLQQEGNNYMITFSTAHQTMKIRTTLKCWTMKIKNTNPLRIHWRNNVLEILTQLLRKEQAEMTYWVHKMCSAYKQRGNSCPNAFVWN